MQKDFKSECKKMFDAFCEGGDDIHAEAGKGVITQQSLWRLVQSINEEGCTEEEVASARFVSALTGGRLESCYKFLTPTATARSTW